MKNVLIIGLGGISSFFCRELNQLIENNVNGVTLNDINVNAVDFDEVEEKNIKYQNFTLDDLGKTKAEAMTDKYEYIIFENKKIEDIKQLDNYDIFVIAVDNGKLRDLIYRYCNGKENKYFIDMRSEGRAISVFTTHKNNTLKYLQSTIDVNKPGTSCQLKFELDNGIIQVGNRIVAMVGIQMLLNYMRGDKNVPTYFARI